MGMTSGGRGVPPPLESAKSSFSRLVWFVLAENSEQTTFVSTLHPEVRLRDWSLITGRGGATKREVWGGGGQKFYPYTKCGGGGGCSFSHPEGGGETQYVLG